MEVSLVDWRDWSVKVGTRLALLVQAVVEAVALLLKRKRYLIRIRLRVR